MKTDQPGLKMRMRSEAQRVPAQHQQLNALCAGVAAALRSGVVKEARRAFRRFQEAFDAHLAVEEQIFFPALHGLCPEFALNLRQLVREHRDLRSRLVSLIQEFAASPVEPQLAKVEEALLAFAAALASHESREEDLMTRITDGP